MSSTRRTLDVVTANLDDSMGMRLAESNPQLAPVPSVRDQGRRPVRQFGTVEVNRVIPDPNQPRDEFSDEDLANLAQSIREKGQLSPIRVRWSEGHQKWMIICGERRWRAAQRAGLSEIECYFHETDLSPSEILEQQLIENCLREDLQPIEEARAYRTLQELNGWTGNALAAALHVSPSRVSRALALLRLPETIQKDVTAGKIAPRSAYQLARVNNHDKRVELAQKASKGLLTAEETAKAVRKFAGKCRPAARSTKQTFLTEDGWKVVVSIARKGSYHEIEQALNYALEEVRHRIDNGIQLY